MFHLRSKISKARIVSICIFKLWTLRISNVWIHQSKTTCPSSLKWHLIGYEPQIVIGACDHYLHIASEIYHSNTGLMLLRVPLGSVFFGPTKKQTGKSNSSVNADFINIWKTENQFKEIWNDDHLDMYDLRKYPSFEDRKALEIMKSSITKENGRFVILQPCPCTTVERDSALTSQIDSLSNDVVYCLASENFEKIRNISMKYIRSGHT